MAYVRTIKAGDPEPLLRGVVKRSFQYRGGTAAPGDIVELKETVARRLRAAGKLRLLAEGEAAAPPAPETAQAPAAETSESRGRRRRGAEAAAEEERAAEKE